MFRTLKLKVPDEAIRYAQMQELEVKRKEELAALRQREIERAERARRALVESQAYRAEQARVRRQSAQSRRKMAEDAVRNAVKQQMERRRDFEARSTAEAQRCAELRRQLVMEREEAAMQEEYADKRRAAVYHANQEYEHQRQEIARQRMLLWNERVRAIEKARISERHEWVQDTSPQFLAFGGNSLVSEPNSTIEYFSSK